MGDNEEKIAIAPSKALERAEIIPASNPAGGQLQQSIIKKENTNEKTNDRVVIGCRL